MAHEFKGLNAMQKSIFAAFDRVALTFLYTLAVVPLVAVAATSTIL